MSIIVSVMGPTGVGKSTFIQEALKNPAIYGAVEVGKALRAKYPPSYFAGQNNPKHTAHEAWELCEKGVKDLLGQNKPVILVDGQPRDLPQVDLMLRSFGGTPGFFLLLHAPADVCEARVRASRAGENLELALQRNQNDRIAYYEVLACLLGYGLCVDVYDTSAGSIEQNIYNLLKMTREWCVEDQAWGNR